MNIIFDLIVLSVILLSFWFGKKNGFVKTFFGFVGSVAAFVLSAAFAKPVGTFLSNRLVFPVMEKYFLNALSQNMGTAVENLNFHELPDSCNVVLSRFGVTADMIEQKIISEGVSAGEEVLTLASDFVVRPLSESVSYAIAYFGLFIILGIAIRIVVKALDLVAKLPILNFSNKALGSIMGIIWGLFLAIFIAGGLKYLQPWMQGNEVEFLNGFDVEKTYLIRILSKIDLLGIFLK